VTLKWDYCRICDAEKWTNEEHVIPDWIEEMFLARGLGPYTAMEDGVAVSEPQKRMDIKMRLCKKCNSRLGNEFEHPASQIMRDMVLNVGNREPSELTPMMQKIIGRWFVKTTVLRYHVGGLPTPEVFWDWLSSKGRPFPPKGTHIWIAKYPMQTQEMPILPEGTIKPQPAFGFDWKAYFSIGELAGFLLYKDSERERPLTHVAEDLGMLSRLLPKHRDSIRWPPEHRVGKTDVSQICDAYVIIGPPRG
jgi:hypothetical protein